MSILKKILYIHGGLSLLNLVFFLTIFSNINSSMYLIIYLIFIVNSFIILYRLWVVKDWEPANSLSLKEKIDGCLLILGNILFIMVLIMVGLYQDQDVNTPTFTLLVFILHSQGVLNYSYIYQDVLVMIKGKKIPLEMIQRLEIQRKFIDQVYLSINTETEENIKLCLSEKEYSYLLNLGSHND